MGATNVYYDNQSCIKLFENPLFHDMLKAHRYQMSFHQGLCIGWGNPVAVYSRNRLGSRHTHEDSRER